MILVLRCKDLIDNGWQQVVGLPIMYKRMFLEDIQSVIVAALTLKKGLC
jgi:hypothetical protein